MTPYFNWVVAIIFFAALFFFGYDLGFDRGYVEQPPVSCR